MATMGMEDVSIFLTIRPIQEGQQEPSTIQHGEAGNHGEKCNIGGLITSLIILVILFSTQNLHYDKPILLLSLETEHFGYLQF